HRCSPTAPPPAPGGWPRNPPRRGWAKSTARRRAAASPGRKSNRVSSREKWHGACGFLLLSLQKGSQLAGRTASRKGAFPSQHAGKPLHAWGIGAAAPRCRGGGAAALPRAGTLPGVNVPGLLLGQAHDLHGLVEDVRVVIAADEGFRAHARGVHGE